MKKQGMPKAHKEMKEYHKEKIKHHERELKHHEREMKKHMDEKEDKQLIRNMVKKGSLKCSCLHCIFINMNIF